MTDADRNRAKKLVGEEWETGNEVWEVGGPLPAPAAPKMSDLVRQRNELLGKIREFLSERYPKSLVPPIDQENNAHKKTCLLEYFGSDRWEDVTDLKIEQLRQGYGRMKFEMDS